MSILTPVFWWGVVQDWKCAANLNGISQTYASTVCGQRCSEWDLIMRYLVIQVNTHGMLLPGIASLGCLHKPKAGTARICCYRYFFLDPEPPLTVALGTSLCLHKHMCPACMHFKEEGEPCLDSQLLTGLRFLHSLIPYLHDQFEI
eukprot:1156241-Pelagomonas_calceolata.AAC.6